MWVMGVAGQLWPSQEGVTGFPGVPGRGAMKLTGGVCKGLGEP